MRSEHWSWAEQRHDTEASDRALSRAAGLAPGTRIALDLRFLAWKTDRDEARLIASLEGAGYAVAASAQNARVATNRAHLPFAVEAIWTRAKETTALALG